MKRKRKKTQPHLVPGYLREHAKALFDMPAGEQFIGGRDAVLFAALHQIADWMEAQVQQTKGDTEASGA